MATKSSIEWTGLTWNPTVGCSEQSPGCTNCYAAKMAYRLMHIGSMAEDYTDLAKRLPNGKIVWTGKVTVLEKRLMEPFLIKKPTVFFVNSMSDLFHPEVPFDFIVKVFEVMAMCPHHTFQILTKQPKRAIEYFSEYKNGMTENFKSSDTFFSGGCSIYVPNGSLKNVWIGVSLENDKYIHRVDELLKIPAAIRFISYEPALGPVDLKHFYHKIIEEKINYNGDQYTSVSESGYGIGVDWVICGGESGNGARPLHPDWVRIVRDQCIAAGVPFFFKQWGEYLPECQNDGIDITGYKIVEFQSPNNPSKKNKYYKMGKHNSGSVIDNQTWKEMPV